MVRVAAKENIKMNYDTSPRTLTEGVERNKLYGDYLPYLNAQRSIHGGYRSSTWQDEDRAFLLWVKAAVVTAIGGLVALVAVVANG
jgi:hypothetical protein